MISATVESGRWLRGKILVAIVLVFALQVALIFALSSRPPVAAPPRVVPHAIQPGHESGELLELMDPTLFALPHRETFSGEAWLRIPPQEFQQPIWSESPSLLALAPEQ